jgi:hypothetical protein
MTRNLQPAGFLLIVASGGKRADLRFAVPRCWSKGDSNCRSLLGLLLMEGRSKSSTAI